MADTASQPSSQASAAPLEPRPSLFDYAAVLLRHRRTLLVVPLVAGVVTAVISLLLPKTWTAHTSFVLATSPSGGLPAGLGAIAGQFGISLGSGNQGDTPQFYVDLVGSREIREALLDSRFPVSGTTTDSAALIDLLHVTGPTEGLRREKATLMVSQMISASASRTTGIVGITVTTRDPALSARVANRLVSLLNQFNLEKRNTQARERRRFVESRLTDAENQLRDAEEALRAFLTRNRQYSAPQLQFEFGRLERQVQVRQEVYLTLRREFETARIQEVNDTPVLSVVDSAVTPASRTSPARTRMTLLSILLGAVVAVLWAFGTEAIHGMIARDSEAFGRLRTLLQRPAPHA
jgi:uncharacterized protein involved in exopolysaccharide biosynthesis